MASNSTGGNTGGPLAGGDLLTLASLSGDTIDRLLETALAMKRDYGPYARVLAGHSAILLFEKPSLRTRISFEVGIAKLGGHAIYMDHSAQRLGERESVTDYGRNLERWVGLIVARVFRHSVVAELAAASRVPVINALCDLYHPCQALADYLTLREKFGSVKGLRIAYVGDGNNVCHSLMHGAAILGAHLVAITPKGREPSAEVARECESLAHASGRGGGFTITNDPEHVQGADAVYTDVWVSMGEAAHSATERKKFLKYQVNEALMAKAGPRAVFMHCLPAKRGQEVVDGVIDSAASVVYDQAENRMHAQNALLAMMFPGGR
ncbi:MAG: ornithine carbamoyltransferase [Leptolyngbya sp. PLA1]|nr:ornithine carbamoyltransferase [Leptolyngbya sp. PLA1]